MIQMAQNDEVVIQFEAGQPNHDLDPINSDTNIFRTFKIIIILVFMLAEIICILINGNLKYIKYVNLVYLISTNIEFGYIVNMASKNRIQIKSISGVKKNAII